MTVLDTKHKRKSAAITAIIVLLLLFVIFNYGLKYLDPPEEYGLAINFGDVDFGSGEPVENTKKVLAPEVIEKEEVIEEVKVAPKEVIIEDVIADEASKEITVVAKKEVKKVPVKEVVKKEVPKEKPKPSKETTDALNSLLNGNSADGSLKGEGDDKKEGVKGSKNGIPNANQYYGNEGTSSGGNYNLAGRKALSKPIEQPDCQEEGIVVVRITVDKTGRVINAVAGVKGSTNTAACLLKPAREAALKTTWNADEKAPANQTGSIIYKFTLIK